VKRREENGGGGKWREEEGRGGMEVGRKASPCYP